MSVHRPITLAALFLGVLGGLSWAAPPEDIWLHVHQAPGAHVLILHRNLNKPIPHQTLHEAAALAAYHSTFRQASKVDVMFTPRKYVKKPRGAPPGLVTVSQYNTIRVAPQANIAPLDQEE